MMRMMNLLRKLTSPFGILAVVLVIIFGSEMRMLVDVSRQTTAAGEVDLTFALVNGIFRNLPNASTDALENDMIIPNNELATSTDNSDSPTYKEGTTTVQVATPVMDASEKQRDGVLRENAASSSSVCQPNWGTDPSKIGRLYFAHTRKAGGSFLRNMLKVACRRHQWTCVWQEGMPVERERREDTLYVTVLRHPVDRVISNYKFEGRWDCGQLVRNKTGFIPTLDNAQSLQDFISRPSEHNTPECFDATNPSSSDSNVTEPPEPKLWICSKLCYLRWFGENFNCLSNMSHSFETAMDRLSQQFHLVVITEWLKIPEYQKALMHMFGIDPERRFGTDTFCSKESRKWNKKFPAILPNETMQQLHKMNQLDVELYEKLTSCPRGNVIFPPALQPTPLP